MKKIFKVIGIIVFTMIILGIGSCFLLSEKLPSGTEGAEAEVLTDQMFQAINKEAWDSTKIVTWEFMGIHDYVWNKETTDLKVSWGKNTVVMNLDEYDGIVLKDGLALEGDEKRKMIDKAFSFFCNDSFWLIAPSKARDEGTSRALVDLENGEKGLLVSYSTGGVTPGDSYLWMLDESGLPTGYKMWTKILPVKGIYSSWEDWIDLPTGAKIATGHDMKVMKSKMTNVKGGQTYAEIGIENPFSE